MFKNAKVVMLSTNQKSEIGLNSYNNHLYNYIPSVAHEAKHLYITSDDEIRKNDWFLADNRISQSHNNGIPNWRLCKCTKIINGWIYCNEIPDEGHNGDWCKKVISTTDKSLKIEVGDEGWKSTQEEGWNEYKPVYEQLPQPSNSFIQKYIEEYNKGNIITDILVEYISEKQDGYCPSIPGAYIDVLKVDKNNTITIKRIKTSYTQEEVDDLLDRNTAEVTNELLKKLFTKEQVKSFTYSSFFIGIQSQTQDCNKNVAPLTLYNNWIKQNL